MIFTCYMHSCVVLHLLKNISKLLYITKPAYSTRLNCYTCSVIGQCNVLYANNASRR